MPRKAQDPTYRRLELHANDNDSEWWRLARQAVEVALGTAMRRGEIIGLRWCDVELLERRLHVRETIVREGRPAIVPAVRGSAWITRRRVPDAVGNDPVLRSSAITP